MRHYFPTKTELLASALWRVGERVDERIRRRAGGGMTLAAVSQRWALDMLDDHLAALAPDAG